MVFLNYHSFFTDKILPCIGTAFLLCTLPPVVAQVAITTAWGFVSDRCFGKPPTWERLPALCHKVADRYSNSKIDGQIVAWAAYLAVFIPACWLAAGLSGSWKIACLYNIIRIGPMYAHFAHTYTLCHMEAHHCFRLFKTSAYNPLSYVFNWWVGFYHGVLPGTFTESHKLNHHRWNNDINDIYSTAGYRRDSLWNFARYVVVWFCYASNFSSLWYFVTVGKWGPFYRTLLGTGMYIGWVYTCSVVFGITFTLITIVYPFVEGNILLAVVNWTWHMFLQGDNDWVNSTTIEHGEEFIFSEEYHVVHHQAPGLHHSKYAARFEKEEAEGKYDIIFQNSNLFELGFTVMFKDYERVADSVKPNPKMTREKVISEIKTRVRHTWW